MTYSNISVALATYNGREFLETQLYSIINQTVKLLEIIIVDDCSTDNTWRLLERFAEKYHFIKIFKNEKNLGVVKTFEKALTLCLGEYIALADQDDYWLPNKLELLMSNIDENWLIHSDAFVVDDKLQIINESFSSIKPYHDNSLEMYYLRNNVTGCTALLKRELIEVALPFPENIIMHDHYLALCAKVCNKLAYIDNKLIKYRQHSQNIIGSRQIDSYNLMISTFMKQVWFLDGLKQVSNVKFNSKQIETSRNYFVSVIACKIPKLSTIKLIYKKFGFFATLSMLLYTIVNKKFAKFCFEITHK